MIFVLFVGLLTVILYLTRVAPEKWCDINPCDAELFASINLNLELLTQFPASNEKMYISRTGLTEHLQRTIL